MKKSWLKYIDICLHTWYHSHITLWAILIVLLISLIFSWYEFTFFGSFLRATCAAVILLRTIRKEKAKRNKK